jgi:hypothetical protein
MFFRHEKAKQQTFEEHMSAARSAGFKTESAGSGRTRIERGNVACTATSEAGGVPVFVERAGVIMGKEIGTLVDGGFQKFFRTPSGKRKPALAEELKAIQDFQEDLREALGLEALYNESLGTVSNVYAYDRVVGRDHGDAHKPWE